MLAQITAWTFPVSFAATKRWPTQHSRCLGGGGLGWGGKPTFSGGIASAWINWTATGQQAIQVTVVTSGGRSLSANVTINVLPEAALLSPASPAIAPNILTLPDGTPLTTDTGSDLLSQ